MRRKQQYLVEMTKGENKSGHGFDLDKELRMHPADAREERI
jgi:hypothetical protein